MLPYAYYLLKVILCSGILFSYYWLLLRNKIYHRYNRFYLLAAVVVSLAMPLIQIDIWHKADEPAQSIKLLQVVTGSNEYLDEIVLTSRQNNFTSEQLVLLLYGLTCFIFCVLFIQVLLKIRTLLKQHQQTVVDNICFVNTTAKGTPFSFLRYIFWNDNIDISTTTGNQIFKHELAHVQQKHSYDKLFINAILIFFWCNPFFWLMRKELNIIHEFMADKIAVEDSDTEAFAAMILQATYPQHRFALTNPFFYSPIKRRLLMLTKNNNTKAGYIGRVLTLPLAVLLFAAFTLKTKTIINAPAYHGKKITVVIDAGHGGKDFGAASLDGNTKEKDLALSIIKKIKELNRNENIEVILTRETDIYQSPPEKANFSKAKNPDLFISVHIDAASKDSAAIKTGMSVLVAKDGYSNVSRSKLFASAIINEFTNNYKIVVNSLPQQQQNGIWIIQESSCPAVLIEAGYITNKKDLAYLQTEEAKETIAKNVLAAIEKYAVQQNVASINGSSIPAVIDTVPKTTSLNTNEEKNQLPKIPENLLYVINGKIMGNGKEGLDKWIKIRPQPIQLRMLNQQEAVIKYGKKGEDGALEIITNPKNTNLTTKDKISKQISDGVKNDVIAFNADSLGDDKVFTQVENEARFPGGDTAWRHYLEKNLDPTVPVTEGWKQGQYKITVSFIVKKDGTISDIKTDKYPGSKTADACINLIKKGPRWEPATQNGNFVTAYRKQPITFVIQNQ